MAQPQDLLAFHQSSPESSKGGGDSYKHEGTPDTRLTAFSPDETSVRSSKVMKLPSLRVPEPAGFPAQISNAKPFGSIAGLQLEKDPFVSSGNTLKPDQRLSPTASAFRPFSNPLTPRGVVDTATPFEGAFDGGVEGGSHHGTHHGTIPVSSALSTDLSLSRCLEISSLTQIVTVDDVEAYLARLEELGSPCQGTVETFSKNLHGFVRFSNIRDACMAQRNIQLGGLDWKAVFISPPDLVLVTSPGSRTLATPYEGQLKLLTILRPNVTLDLITIEALLRHVLQAEGDLFAFHLEQGLEDGSLRAIIEYADTGVALEAISKYRHGLNVDGMQLILSFRKVDGFATPADPFDGLTTPVATPLRTPMTDFTNGYQTLSLAKTPQGNAAMVQSPHHNPSSMGLPVPPQFGGYPWLYRGQVPPMSPLVFDAMPQRNGSITAAIPGNLPLVGGMFPQSPTPTASQGFQSFSSDFGNPRSFPSYHRADGRRQNAMRIARAPYFNPAGHHNHVDVNRIREGIDVRTTIMLRNIPNKVDQAMLKTIVDESSWGKYDFMYLRIDFANDCNVGYAFINFVDPLDIIAFVNARGNQRWNCFKSDKVAEISYATIQGKDCLVQKFRNSSVMLEAPHYRPKLYYTSNGPVPELAGQEEPFPPPDNQSKMKRSCENAEHIGLFTPNAGQHFRDEQRRRRSQYDRGTRLAALEEYDIETAIGHMYITQ